MNTTRIKYLDMDECPRVAFNELLVVGSFCMGIPFGVWWLGCRLLSLFGWEGFYNVFHVVGFAVALFFAFGLTWAAKGQAAAASYGALFLDALLAALFFWLVRGEFWTLWTPVALVGLAAHFATKIPAVAAREKENDRKEEEKGLDEMAEVLVAKGVDPAEVRKAVDEIRAEPGEKAAWSRLMMKFRKELDAAAEKERLEEERKKAEEEKRKAAERAARAAAAEAAERKAREEAEARLRIQAAEPNRGEGGPDGAVVREILGEMLPIPGQSWRMGRYPVTQRQWEAVMGNNPSSNDFHSENHPVENVSYDDVLRFVERLNAAPAVKRRGVTFRLPDSEEWDWAFRGCEVECLDRRCVSSDQAELHFVCLLGESDLNEFGFSLTRSEAITRDILNKSAWWCENCSETQAVGRKRPNFLGLYDLLGNVYEWTSTEGESGRICRGGCYHSFIVGNAMEEWEGFQEQKEFADSDRDESLGLRLCADGYDLEPLPDPVLEEEPDGDGEEPPPED